MPWSFCVVWWILGGCAPWGRRLTVVFKRLLRALARRARALIDPSGVGAFGMLVAAQGYAVSDGAGPETLDAVRMVLRRLHLLCLRRASDAARRLLGDTRFTRTLLAFRYGKS